MSLDDIYKAHLLQIFKKSGKVVLYNGYSSYGFLFNDPTDALTMNNKQYAINDTNLTLTFITGSLGTIKNNTTINIDGNNYKINKMIPINTGLESKMWLTTV